MERTTPEKMTKRAGFPVILKRLNDLESELADVFRLPHPTETQDDLRNDISFDDIVQRFEFLKNLYTAEVSSHGETKEQFEIAKRIKDLEHTFHHWNVARFAHNNMEETLSLCSSCTQKRLHEQEQERGVSDSSVSRPEDFYVGSSSSVSVREYSSDEESPKKGRKTVQARAERRDAGKLVRAGRDWGNICTFCGVFGSGVIFGAIIVVTVMSADFQQNEAFFHLPPT